MDDMAVDNVDDEDEVAAGASPGTKEENNSSQAVVSPNKLSV